MNILLSILTAVSILGTNPGFEICVNGCVLSSSDKVWRMAVKTDGDMTVTSYRGRGRWRGLTVMVDREKFADDTTIVRERLRLTSSRPGAFRLTYADGRCRLRFPVYGLGLEEDASCTEIRMADFRPGLELGSCHMFHVVRMRHGAECDAKGPFLLMEDGRSRYLATYEHASQDHTFGDNNPGMDASKVDASQGIEGDTFNLGNDDLWFISQRTRKRGKAFEYSCDIRRGGYVDGEAVPTGSCYETVWTSLRLLPEGMTLQEACYDYVMNRITGRRVARTADFYYNTWGMQRKYSPHMRDILTETRVFREIDLASELGIDTFVLDDGWQDRFGDWNPHPDRFPDGLGPYVERCRSKGIRPGIWLSLIGADKASAIALEHPEIIIPDRNGNPVIGQWKCPVIDIVGSTGYDHVLGVLKRLADDGIRFFKWDAVNTFSSPLSGQGHGDGQTPVKQRIDRYNYLLPFAVTRLMKDLSDYCPDAVVEIDLTEPQRALCGLQPLQEGKFFWMNNGAGSYEDYGSLRSKSMRTVCSVTSGIIPPEVMTYATYPHDIAGCGDYNLATTLMEGHGLWGDLTTCDSITRGRTLRQIAMARRILGKTNGQPVIVEGNVGGSPEIYVQASPAEGYALLTAFSGTAGRYEYRLNIDSQKVASVIGAPYAVNADGLTVTLDFPGPDTSVSVFITGKE